MATIELKKQERNIEVELNKRINNDLTEKRYFVAELIKKALDKYLDFDDMVANNTLSLYKLPIVNKELSIIDFEINSLAVHVVVTVDRAKNKNVYIPQIYKQLHYKPAMILFVNFSKAFTKMEMLGYITDINFQKMTIAKDALGSIDNLIDTLQNTKPKTVDTSESIINTTNELMLAYIDNDLSDEGKRFFIKNLLANKVIRKNYKLFYSLNFDFISIAKTHEIDKINPAELEAQEEQQQNKIDLQSRSDYLRDKAISKYEPENEDEDIIVDEEIEQSLLSEFEQENENIQENNNIDENILEFSLQDLTKESEIQEDIQEDNTYIETEELTDENIPADEEQVLTPEEPEQEAYVDNEEEITDEVTTDNFTQDTNEEVTTDISTEEHNDFELNVQEDEAFELSLEDDEIIDLSQTGFDDTISDSAENNDLETQESVNVQESVTEIIDENEIENVEENINTITTDELSEAIELEPGVEEILANSNDTELEDINIEVNDEELEAILNSDNNYSDETYVTETVQTTDTDTVAVTYTDTNTNTNNENLEDISEDEDLFAFLSDMSNEEQLPNGPAATETTNETYAEQTQPVLSSQETDQRNNNKSSQDDIPPEAYVQQNINATELNVNVPPQQKRKSSSGKLLLALILTFAVGTGLIYTNKDAIMSKLSKGNSGEDIQGLALDNNAELPAPLSATNTPANNQNDTVQTPEKVAPAPTTVNNTATDNVPPAQNAPTLPNLPSTTVEPPKAKHMNDAIANALTKDFSGVRISKVSWEASETLVNNPDVKRYLTITGKSVKNALSQDLIAATEPSFKDTVIVSITYRKDGSVSKIDITDSSGSAQIDGIVKKSVDNTLRFVKMPALNLTTPEYSIKLIIRL